MILGGPTAGAWVAFLGTFDRRELQSQPWYGVLANHASIAIAAVAGGITYAWLATALQTATGDPGMARFVAILAAGVVLESVANALAITTIKIRDQMSWPSVVAIVIDDFRRETLLEIALVWILVIGSITVGWWAPLVIGLAVVGYLATYRESGIDDLTGLLKKRAFLAKVDRKVGWMRLGARGGTMLFFDIDRFSRFNNAAGGYEVGDEIIKVVAERMKDLLRREGDILARLMGDEFAVFFMGMIDQDAARQRALELIAAVERPIALGDRVESITISVGILIEEGRGIATWSASAMLERAVVAEKHAKVDKTDNPHLWVEADGTSFEYVATHKGHPTAE
jgi:diguanylate cyclase (GGDEF)-like protein